MKTTLILVALLVPAAVQAYPNPDITPAQTTGQLVRSIWLEPTNSPLALDDAGEETDKKSGVANPAPARDVGAGPRIISGVR